MIVYRISSIEYSGQIQSSGIAARWNLQNQRVLYTSETRSLACLENIVHRSMTQLSGLFRTQVIEIPDSLKIITVEVNNLPAGWISREKVDVCREMGSSWYLSGKSPVLKVPSALIPQEHNYIIQTLHPDFSLIRMLSIENFQFDPRIKLD
ncbi:MAG: RES family NAD+ phosphorylase [Bacteroidetes bacterium]|nr:RES family NAD+ phosphorylase [Bacteroidota bacterium]